MKLFFTVLVSFIFCKLYAQAPNLQWSSTFGGSSSDQAAAIEQTKDSGYIIAGSTSSNDADVSGNHGGSDGWLIKLNKLHEVQWKYCYGSSGDEFINAVHQTSDSGYIIAGYTSSSDITGYQGSTDYWVAKISKAGALQWQRAMGGTVIDIANSVRQTSDGGYVIAGVSASNDGDLPFEGTEDDMWIVKLNSSGTSIEWQKVFFSSLGQAANDIQQTPDGGYVIAGYSAASGYDVPLNLGGFDCWIIKLDQDRNIVWNKILGGSANDVAKSVQLCNDGGYIIAAGSRSNNADVTGNHGSNDYWIVKLRANGSIEWQKSLGGSGYDLATMAKQTADGGYIVAGYTESTNGQVTGNHGSGDYWLVKLDSAGALSWQKTIGGSLNDQAFSVAISFDQEYIIAGSVFSTDGDINGNHGSNDLFIAQTNSTIFSVLNQKNGKGPTHRLVEAKKSNIQVNGDPIEIKVSADNSSSTIIIYTGQGAQTKKLVLPGHPEINGSYTSEWGQLIVTTRTNDSLVYLYHHPQYVFNGDNTIFKSYDFNIIDTISTNVVVTGQLKIYHAPVLMIHGVWSSIHSFEQMEKYILNNSNNFEPFQLSRIWFKTPVHEEPRASAYYYRNIIPDGINSLLQKCLTQNISGGKVNIVGHSRGGLLARYYLQSNFVNYNNDINSLITLNSPHSGSQTSNLVLDNRLLLNDNTLGSYVQKYTLLNEKTPFGTYKDDINGAYELMVNSSAIMHELNGPSLNKKTVPSHAITSSYKVGLTYQELNNFKTISGIAYFGLRFAAFLLRSDCGSTNVDDCIKEIFNGEDNDLIVPLSSQSGGLSANAVTYLTENIAHSHKKFDDLHIATGITEATPCAVRIIQLLRQNPYSASSNFTMNGFHPADLSHAYNFLPGLNGNPNPPLRINSSDSVKILAGVAGFIYHYGDTVSISANSSSSIQNILLKYDGPSLSETISDVNTGNSISRFIIPKEAVGKINITAYGFSNSTLLAIDSAFINTGIPGASVLDSIKIIKEPDHKLYVYAGDSIPLNIVGYYSDTQRIISQLNGFTYQFFNGSIASILPGKYLKGIIPNSIDTLLVNFLGKKDSVFIQIEDSIVKAEDYYPKTVRSVNNGNWSQPSTWNTNKVPDANSNVIIESQVTVDIDGNCKTIEIKSPGKLTVTPGFNIDIGMYFH